jgi:DNA-binding NtrC family response regulator
MQILIFTTDKLLKNQLKDFFIFQKCETEFIDDEQEAFKLLKKKEFNTIFFEVSDFIKSPLEILNQNNSSKIKTPIVFISKNKTPSFIVKLMKYGAFDFLPNPFEIKDLVEIFKDLKIFIKSNEINSVKKNEFQKIQSIIGQSDSIKKIKSIINIIANTEAKVLITGENGVGKELVAKWIHQKSNRKSNPFIEVNCAAIPNDLIESELFGHEKGSFTSAIKMHIGKFEQANNGTLFLDEIGDMSLHAQAKVLRALQENEISRVGSDKSLPINVRIIAATNKNLLEEIKLKNFRIDLYHRLSVITLHIPSLNQRREDIPALIDFFLTKIAEEYGESKKNIDEDAINKLIHFNWTGNIRELRNVVERLIILSGDRITLDDVVNFVLINQKLNISSSLSV